MKKYYGIELLDGRYTTAGEPNKRTGRMSIACDVVTFTTKGEQSEWGSESRRHIPITKKMIRAFHLGMSSAEYDEFLKYVESKEGES